MQKSSPLNHMISIWVLAMSFFLSHQATRADVKSSLIAFLAKLNSTNGQPDPSFGWNQTSDPCEDKWVGVACDRKDSIKKITLENFGLSGIFDPVSLCSEQRLASSLNVLSLQLNNVSGQLPADIRICRRLTHLFIGRNQFSGNVPDSLPGLKLRRLDISYNQFTGNSPDFSRVSGLLTFFAQYNRLEGAIPNFNFSSLQEFNVSYNNLSGPVPDVKGRFDQSSFIGNPGLCGFPLSNSCPSPIPPENNTTAPPPAGNNTNGGPRDFVSVNWNFPLLLFSSVFLLSFW